MIQEKDVKVIKDVKKYTSTYNIKTIIENTVETWQPNRTSTAKSDDTKLGKLAEDIISGYIKSNIPHIEYLSYDNFRTNNFRKHAPFDGLIFSKNINIDTLKTITEKINIEITDNEYGKISDTLKQECLQNHIYIVEVKSTRVADRHKHNGSNININAILNDDFLEYPKYLRVDKYDKINNFSDYIEFSKRYRGFVCQNHSSCEDDIKLIEKANMRHIYIRIYIDEGFDTAYIIGCISMVEFINKAMLKKMKKYNKSELALYLATPLKNGVNIDSLSKIK